ncbi:MAG: transporter substrate-binding domain-containing protein [Desulfovibrio sp.]|nr:transporter substrate-binding domain-containing protein [Desulfovibrio sp.]
MISVLKICVGLLIIIAEVFIGSRAFFPDVFLTGDDEFEPILASRKSILDKLSPEEVAYIIENPVVRVGVDPGFYPLEAFNERGRHEGLAADYLRLLEKMTGLKFSPVRTKDWAETEKLAREGRIDMFSAAAGTGRRGEYMLFTAPYVNLPGVVMARRDSDMAANEAKELAGKKIAVVRDYSWQDYLRDFHPEAVIIEAPTTLDALELVASGQADAVLDYEFNLLEKIQTGEILQMRNVDRVDASYGHSMAVRKDLQPLFNIISAALAEISPRDKAALAKKWLEGERRPDAAKHWQWIFFFFVQAILLCMGVNAWYGVRARKELNAALCGMRSPSERPL